MLNVFVSCRYDQRRCQRNRDQHSSYRSRPTTHHPHETDDYDEETDDNPIDPDYPYPPNGNSFGRDGLIDVASNAISQCPIENGVMRTTWGAVAVGPLIAGEVHFQLKHFNPFIVFFFAQALPLVWFSKMWQHVNC